MKDLFPSLIAAVLSAFLFTTLFNITGWNKKVWNLINKIVKPQYNLAIWILVFVAINILIEILFVVKEVVYTDIIESIVLGFNISIMPIKNLEKKKNKL